MECFVCPSYVAAGATFHGVTLVRNFRCVPSNAIKQPKRRLLIPPGATCSISYILFWESYRQRSPRSTSSLSHLVFVSAVLPLLLCITYVLVCTYLNIYIYDKYIFRGIYSIMYLKHPRCEIEHFFKAHICKLGVISIHIYS